MELSTLKFKTVQRINGVSYLSEPQIEGLKAIMCHELKLEGSDEQHQAIEEAIEVYFKAQDAIGIKIR